MAFVEGVSVRQRYVKQVKSGNDLFIQDYELKALLEGESGGRNWKSNKPATTLNPRKALENALTSRVVGTSWIRDDGAIATIIGSPKLSRSIIFELPAAKEFEQRQKAANDARQRTAVPKF